MDLACIPNDIYEYIESIALNPTSIKDYLKLSAINKHFNLLFIDYFNHLHWHDFINIILDLYGSLSISCAYNQNRILTLIENRSDTLLLSGNPLSDVAESLYFYVFEKQKKITTSGLLRIMTHVPDHVLYHMFFEPNLGPFNQTRLDELKDSLTQSKVQEFEYIWNVMHLLLFIDNKHARDFLNQLLIDVNLNLTLTDHMTVIDLYYLLQNLPLWCKILYDV
jgi:hypothetical protein